MTFCLNYALIMVGRGEWLVVGGGTGRLRVKTIRVCAREAAQREIKV